MSSFRMMPNAPPPERKRPSFPVWLIALPIGAVLMVVAFVATWQYLTPREREPMVPYSAFMTDVHDGNVERIQIREREIHYRSRRGNRVLNFETLGPEPDQAMLDSLKPTDPSKPAPIVSLVK